MSVLEADESNGSDPRGPTTETRRENPQNTLKPLKMGLFLASFLFFVGAGSCVSVTDETNMTAEVNVAKDSLNHIKVISFVS